MRKIVIILFVAIAVFTTGMSKPEEAIHININGQVLNDIPSPIIVNNTILIPIRAVSYLGVYEVNWNKTMRTITVDHTATKESLKLTIGKTTALKNNQSIQLTTAPAVYQNTTYVPLRFIGEAFGATVVWNHEERGVAIFTPDPDIISLAESNDLPSSRVGVVGLPRVSWQMKTLDQPEGMTYSYIFPENESGRFYYQQGSSVYYYEVRAEHYAELIWEAKIDFNSTNENLKDTFSNYIGLGFNPKIGNQPTISKRLIYFHDTTFVNGNGQFGVISQDGDETSSHEVRAWQLSEIILHVPEEGKVTGLSQK